MVKPIDVGGLRRDVFKHKDHNQTEKNLITTVFLNALYFSNMD